MPSNDRTVKSRTWLHVLFAGLVIWIAGIAATAFTRDPVLIPGVFLVGSFLVPFSLLFWIFEESGWGKSKARFPTVLDPYRLLLAFATGGALGVWCSALLEDLLMRVYALMYYLDVAVVEESVKLILVWLLARKLGSYSRRDGMLLGGAVGLGFSAFESAGYAFNGAYTDGTINVVAILQTQVSRGLLTPVGHGLWTALVAGALFAAARNNRLRLNWNVVGWLLVAIGLHMFWDMAGGFSAMLAAALTGQQVNSNLFLSARLTDPSLLEGAYYATFDTLLLCVDAAVGLLLGVRQWRKADRELAAVLADRAAVRIIAQ